MNQLEHGDHAARLAAIRAIGAIGPEARAAVPILVLCLKDKELRGTSSFALGEMGADARAAVPALIETLRDGSDEARAEAAGALSRIGGVAAPELIAALQANDGTGFSSRQGSSWFDELVKDEPQAVIAGLVIVSLAAIAAAVVVAVLWIRHRERIARIEKGLDLDPAPTPRESARIARS